MIFLKVLIQSQVFWCDQYSSLIVGSLTDWWTSADVGTTAPITQSSQQELGGSICLAVTSLGPRWFPCNKLWAWLPPESLVDNLTKLSQDKWVTGRRRQERGEREQLDLSVMFWWKMRIAASAGASRSPQVNGKIVFGCIGKKSTAGSRPHLLAYWWIW